MSIKNQPNIFITADDLKAWAIDLSEACGDEDETWRASGVRGPSKINTLDYVERGPHYEMGDDVQPPTSPDETLDADPFPPPIPKTVSYTHLTLPTKMIV